MIERPYYVDWLKKWKDHDIIKVVTGIRRCGKSRLFDLYRASLLRDGVPERHIIALDFEDPDLDALDTSAKVWNRIKRLTPKSGKTYVFLDEVQRVESFEKLVDGLFSRKNYDVYITGSNAYCLSGDLATYLFGRYVELKMQPLSFREFVYAQGREIPSRTDYAAYQVDGSFPYVLSLGGDKAAIRDYLSGVFNTILLKDVVRRAGIADITVLERLVRFLFDNIGSLVSIKKVCDTLMSASLKTNGHTIGKYLAALRDAFLVYEVPRFDVKGREILSSGQKYYVADTGLRTMLLGTSLSDQGHLLENIVYLDLRRRFQDVRVGTFNRTEIDFVAQNGGDVRYFQVALTALDERVRERELRPLASIRDSHPKYLLTLDDLPLSRVDGIQCLNALDFMMQPIGAE